MNRIQLSCEMMNYIKTFKTTLNGKPITWDLNPTINILGGENGSGKTTLLKRILYDIEMVSDDEVVGYSSNLDDHIIMGSCGLVPDAMYLSFDEYPLHKIVNASMIHGTQECYSVIDILLKEILTTSSEIRNQGGKFKKHMSKFIPNPSSELMEMLRSITSTLDESVQYQKLSSGEKHLMFIILTVMKTCSKPTILLLDNVQSSLHIDIQKKLLIGLMDINPNLQIICATQSPSVVDGLYEQIDERNQSYKSWTCIHVSNQ